MQGLNAIVWEADPHTLEFSFVSEHAEEVLGYPVERWLSEPGFFAAIMHPDDRHEVVARCGAEIRSGRDHEADFRMIAADGRTLAFHEVVRVHPGGVRGVMVERTNRREGDAFTHFQARLVDEIDAAVIATDPRGVVTYWSRHAEGLLGWTQGEAIGRSVSELHVPQGALPEALSIHTRLLDGKPFRGELEYRTKDGEAVPVYCRASTIRGDRGQVTGLIAISDDLTARKRVDEQIRFQARLLDSLDAAVIATDTNQVIKHWSSRAEELYGWSAGEALGRDSAEVLVSANGTAAPGVGEQASESWEREYAVLRKNGEPVRVWARCGPVRDDAGEVIGRVSLVVDISERHRLTQDVSDSEAAKSAILRAALDAIVTIDEDGLVTEFNPAAEQLFGYTRDEALGRELAELIVPPRLRDRHRAGLRRLVETGEGMILDQRVELTAMRSDGSEVPVELVVTRMEGDGPARFAGFVRDLSERRKAESHAAQLSELDPLTGVSSLGALRRQLSEALSAADSEGRAVALLQVDLRRFSLVNDSLGRTRGDELLREVATRLVELEPAPVAVGREGGDEFWVISMLAASSRGDRWREEATRTVERFGEAVQDALAEPFSVGGAKVSLQAGIGTSIYPLDARNPETMLEHAEAATRQAQRTVGRPAVAFSGHAGDPRAELALMTRLSGALGREEFELHYQPIVDLKAFSDGADGAVVGVEALLRWRDPEQGLVPPARFLGLLEDTGLIAGVGSWVASELVRQLASWRREGVAIEGSFNLSARELWQPDLAERLVAVTQAQGLEPNALTVEITESAAMVDPEAAERVLAGLRECGFKLAIDDFGTGHSSLGRLRDLPVDVLKIDRSFTSEVPGDGPTVAIVDAILAAALGLGLLPVVEGIETEEQLAFMLERGCTQGQGFLFGRPVPPDELEF